MGVPARTPFFGAKVHGVQVCIYINGFLVSVQYIFDIKSPPLQFRQLIGRAKSCLAKMTMSKKMQIKTFFLCLLTV